MSGMPATGSPGHGRLLALRLRLARAAIWWERLWPAAWPALCVLGIFAALALFDLLTLLPGWLHAALLATLALGFAGAVFWGWRTAFRGIAAPDTVAARRRIERSSDLAHRPLEALADRPSAPLDGEASILWEAHRRRMEAAARRLRIGWPVAGLARHDPWGLRSVLIILLLLAAIDAGADRRDRIGRALSPTFQGGPPGIATSFDLYLTPPDYTGLPPKFLHAGEGGTVQVPTGSKLLAQVHGTGAAPQLKIDGEPRDFEAVDKQNFRIETTLTSGKSLGVSQGRTVLGQWPIAVIPDQPPTVAFAQPPKPTPRAALRLDYHAGDDYGVESVKAVIRREGDNPDETIE
ncbi:MAG TPA: DUF4175 family protein, partial [Stellaceae bacterium]